MTETDALSAEEKDERYWAERCYHGGIYLRTAVEVSAILCVISNVAREFYPVPLMLRLILSSALGLVVITMIVSGAYIWKSKRQQYPLVDNVGEEMLNAYASLLLYGVLLIAIIILAAVYGNKAVKLTLVILVAIAVPVLLVWGIIASSKGDTALKDIRQGKQIHFEWTIPFIR